MTCSELRTEKIDRASLYSILNRLIQAGGGFITILFVSTKLTSVEQGYLYSFNSLIALQIFFEIGLSITLVQFYAHQKGQNETLFNAQNTKEIISRIKSIFQFSLRLYSIIAILYFIVVTYVGIQFFSHYRTTIENVEWSYPWVILTLATSLSLSLSPILALIEGLGKIKLVMLIRLCQTTIQITFSSVFFLLNLKLYSIPLATICALLIIIIWITKSNQIRFIRQYMSKPGEELRSKYLIKQILKYQWKIALSWISGYFIFQLFNPVLFATEGPTIAGKIGLTLNIFNTLLALSLSWINTKVAIFSRLIGTKSYGQLDKTFNSSKSIGLNIIILIMATIQISVWYLEKYNITFFGIDITERMITSWPLLFLSISVVLNYITSALATYLRCHNREPLLVQSIIIGILWTSFLFIFKNYITLKLITFGYLILIIISTISTYFIYRVKKKLWHQ
jgi:hypothetical protein